MITYTLAVGGGELKVAEKPCLGQSGGGERLTLVGGGELRCSVFNNKETANSCSLYHSFLFPIRFVGKHI